MAPFYIPTFDRLTTTDSRINSVPRIRLAPCRGMDDSMHLYELISSNQLPGQKGSYLSSLFAFLLFHMFLLLSPMCFGSCCSIPPHELSLCLAVFFLSNLLASLIQYCLKAAK
jgi:hypothetical protein